jgi:predicted thioesterase
METIPLGGGNIMVNSFDNVNHKIYEGLSMTYEKVTTAADSYISNATSIDNLLSSPSLLSMIIDISCKLLDKLLPANYVTVGRNLELSHYNPTLIGEKISLTIKVKKVDKQRVYLEFVGSDYLGDFCKGKYEKVIVDKSSLLESAIKRAKL